MRIFNRFLLLLISHTIGVTIHIFTSNNPGSIRDQTSEKRFIGKPDEYATMEYTVGISKTIGSLNYTIDLI